MDPKGAAPGGKSFGRAPTGGLRGCDGLRALFGTKGGGGRLFRTAPGGVALLFRSLFVGVAPGDGRPPPLLLGGVELAELTGPGAFMSGCKMRN